MIEAMHDDGARVFVEVGPGSVLTALVGSILGDRPHLAVACDPPGRPGSPGLLATLGRLFVAGVPLDLATALTARPCRRAVDRPATDSSPTEPTLSPSDLAGQRRPGAAGVRARAAAVRPGPRACRRPTPAVRHRPTSTGNGHASRVSVHGSRLPSLSRPAGADPRRAWSPRSRRRCRRSSTSSARPCSATSQQRSRRGPPRRRLARADAALPSAIDRSRASTARHGRRARFERARRTRASSRASAGRQI